MNAIVWAARKGISIEGGTMYCTYEPCFDCMRAIIAAGLTRIVYSEKYKHHAGDEAEQFAKENGASIQQITISKE